MLARARGAVESAVGGMGAVESPPPVAEAPSQRLALPAAAFVTLHVGGALRGCIGTSEARRSLWQVVAEMAEAAATRDRRFAPIAIGELPQLTIEISVLGEPRRMNSPREIAIGRHGIDIRQGGARGLLLPQVAVEHALGPEQFLGETCRKAGLPAGAWRDPTAEVRLFEADVFSEPTVDGHG